MTYLFIFTATVCILNTFKMVSIIAGNDMSFPGKEYVRPSYWVWMYSCALYQVWFWAVNFNIIQ